MRAPAVTTRPAEPPRTADLARLDERTTLGQYALAGIESESVATVGRKAETMAKLDHLGLKVADRNRATDWHVEQLGLEVEFELRDVGVTAIRDEADFTIFLSEAANVVAECTLYFQVDNVDRLHCSLADRGVAFVYAPQPNPWGYGAELLDPDGHAVRLWDEGSMKRHAALLR